jgi:hypothetical protein
MSAECVLGWRAARVNVQLLAVSAPQWADPGLMNSSQPPQWLNPVVAKCCSGGHIYCCWHTCVASQVSSKYHTQHSTSKPLQLSPNLTLHDTHWPSSHSAAKPLTGAPPAVPACQTLLHAILRWCSCLPPSPAHSQSPQRQQGNSTRPRRPHPADSCTIQHNAAKETAAPLTDTHRALLRPPPPAWLRLAWARPGSAAGSSEPPPPPAPPSWSRR